MNNPKLLLQDILKLKRDLESQKMKTPPVLIVEKIAKALGTSIEDLI